MIDIRCTGHLPVRSDDDASRCQLVAGHEGPHALMFSRDGRRIVRRWHRSGGLAVRDHLAGQELAPWVRGKPEPAWTEARGSRRLPVS